jgi:hypothetical protein
MVTPILMSACAGITPETAQLGTALLAAVGQNYGGKYYQEVNKFYQTLSSASEEAVEAAEEGRPWDPGKTLFGGQAESSEGEANEPEYGDSQEGSGYESYGDEEYTAEYADDYDDGSSDETDSYGGEENGEDEYGDESYGGDEYEGEGAGEASYGEESYAEEDWEDETVSTAVLADSGILALDVAVMRRIFEDGREGLEVLENGDVIVDGDGDPDAADKIQIFFRPNIEAYVYVISVDATGWVQPIFPNAFPDDQNPLSAGSTTLLPGAGYWLTLDRFKGMEHLYFVASEARREELEMQLADFASKSRPETDDPVAVSVPAVVEQAFIQTRGFLGVRPGESTTIAAIPTAFSFGVPGVDLVVTRYFDHQ